jgi:DNA-binding transcriptional regulator YdaS (Cro superfamily)
MNIYLTKVYVNLSILPDKPTIAFIYQGTDVNTNQKNLSIATLQLAIEQAGGLTALARLMPDSPSRQAVDNWTRNGVPAKRAVHIEKALKGKIRRQELRPDLYA